VLSALTTVLFLGGWHGPFEDQLGWVWTLTKIFLVAFVVVWVRVAYPRLREDQLQRLAWQGLVPLVLFQLAITAVGVVMTQ
jgi:NADH-quinone oxidoreductase subunit H